MGNVTFEYDKSLDIAFFTIEGDIGYKQLREEVEKYYRDHLTRFTLWDFTKAEPVLSTEELRMIAKYVVDQERKRPTGTGCVTTIVVSGLLKYGLARMFVAFNEVQRNDGTTITTRIFHSREEAVDWIKTHHYPKNQTDKGTRS